MATCFVLVLALEVRVRAQDAAAPAPQTATVTPALDAERWRDAEHVVGRAEALFTSGNYEAALTEFERSYERLDGHPRQYVVLNNMAACHMRLFRYDQALVYYERYLREGGPAAEDSESVRGMLDMLRGLLATVEVSANVAGDVWVDNRRVGEVPKALHIPAGYHLIEVRATLHEGARREVTLIAGTTLRVQMTLLPLSTYRGLDPVYGWIAGGVTVALAGSGAALGASTLAARDTRQSHADTSMGLQTAQLDADRERIRDRALATDIVLGAAVVSGITAFLLFMLSDRGEVAREPRTTAKGTWPSASH